MKLRERRSQQRLSRETPLISKRGAIRTAFFSFVFSEKFTLTTVKMNHAWTKRHRKFSEIEA